VAYVVSLYICLYVGLFVLKMYCGKTTEWIQKLSLVVIGSGVGVGVLCSNCEC